MTITYFNSFEYPVYTNKLARRAGYMLTGRASSMFARSGKRSITEMNCSELAHQFSSFTSFCARFTNSFWNWTEEL